jgi:hypothetical protein
MIMVAWSWSRTNRLSFVSSTSQIAQRLTLTFQKYIAAGPQRSGVRLRCDRAAGAQAKKIVRGQPVPASNGGFGQG